MWAYCLRHKVRSHTIIIMMRPENSVWGVRDIVAAVWCVCKHIHDKSPYANNKWRKISGTYNWLIGKRWREIYSSIDRVIANNKAASAVVSARCNGSTDGDLKIIIDRVKRNDSSTAALSDTHSIELLYSRNAQHFSLSRYASCFCFVIMFQI